MTKQLAKDAFGWGFGLWLFGYILGFIFFALVPVGQIGWYIMPIATAVTLWVLWKKVRGVSWEHYLGVAFVWTALAIVLDYFFLVRLLQPEDGYYKLDVYLYYALTFALPLLVGWRKK